MWDALSLGCRIVSVWSIWSILFGKFPCAVRFWAIFFTCERVALLFGRASTAFALDALAAHVHAGAVGAFVVQASASGNALVHCRARQRLANLPADTVDLWGKVGEKN